MGGWDGEGLRGRGWAVRPLGRVMPRAPGQSSQHARRRGARDARSPMGAWTSMRPPAAVLCREHGLHSAAARNK